MIIMILNMIVSIFHLIPSIDLCCFVLFMSLLSIFSNHFPLFPNPCSPSPSDGKKTSGSLSKVMGPKSYVSTWPFRIILSGANMGLSGCLMFLLPVLIKGEVPFPVLLAEMIQIDYVSTEWVEVWSRPSLLAVSWWRELETEKIPNEYESPNEYLLVDSPQGCWFTGGHLVVVRGWKWDPQDTWMWSCAWRVFSLTQGP